MAGADADADADAHKVRGERDLYRSLLRLGEQTELDPFLSETLQLIVEATGSEQGYIELREPSCEESEGWSATRTRAGSAQPDAMRSLISQGIIGEALATGETIMTASALCDERFAARGSVRLAQIRSVLCVPIGREPSLGVVYLASGAEASFSEADRARAEMLARHIAPIADRALLRERERSDATRELRRQLRLDGIIGRSQALAAVFRQLALVAPLEVTVLLTGDTGTGKSQLARALHENSPREKGPFVDLNCAALPENLIENELFGARAGAHSMARRPMSGKVSAAEGGTLFLDEIGDLPPPAQAKLLQLLQSRQYWPLGASEPVVADVRLVASTNTDLERAVAEHRFRQDLFYRLHVLPIRMPALAERREDLEVLSTYFCVSASERHRLRPVQLSRGALRGIQHAEWPGNVRQLQHAIEAAVIRAVGEGGACVELRHVFPERCAGGSGEPAQLTYQEATRRFQRQLLHQTLEETQGNVAAAARRLDLARSYLYTLIKDFEIDVERD